MSIRDISGWVYPGMWSYFPPDYPGAQIEELSHPTSLPEDYAAYCQRFVIGGQTGTYIETKAHVSRAAEPVTALCLEQFCRPAVVIDVGAKGTNEPILVADLERAAPDLRPGDAALLCTGWDRHWDDPEYVEGSPYIEREAAMWLFEREIGLLASDFPRFDYVPAMQFPWADFWDRVNLLLAPVTNLVGLSGRCGTLMALPLKIRNACATPCRAVLLLGD